MLDQRAQPRRGKTLLAGAVTGVCACLALASGPPVEPSDGARATARIAGDRVEIRTNDARTITGTLVVEAVDGGLVLEHDDGRYELFEPAAVTSRAAIKSLAPPTADTVSQQILASLPAGFDTLRTKHYIICFDTTRDYAKWCAALFERLHEAFGNYWSKAGIEISGLDRPLIVVIFADRQAYAAHAEADLGTAADRVVGYYNLMNNRVMTYDITGSDALAAGRGRRPGQVGLEILTSPAASGMVATIVHEATHQLAFNRGLHQRLAAVPVWVSEGIATYFETPDLENARGWRAIGAVNRPRLDHFLATYRPGGIESIITSDEPFRQVDSALDAYAASWALTHHLFQTKKRNFIAYQKQLGEKPPLGEDSAEIRLQEFRDAFGEPRDVEQAVYKAAARLASRSR
jgi:hypothetical protein